MEESSLSPETPYFGPSKILNFSDQLKKKLDYRSNSISKEKKNAKRKKNKNKSKSKSKSKNKTKKNKHISEKLPISNLYLDKKNMYYELLTKKLKLKNDFDRKHTEIFLAEVEEGFKECDLDDKISEDEY